jgi:MoCo/4Fe-4S cofactor protein with predicted Tat translocation signal
MKELDLPTVRARLEGRSGRQFWRSLEELAETPGFDEFLKREFPRQSNGWLGPVSRREFLKTMGAGLALAGLTSCASEPADRIVPYVNKPEELIPGKPLFYATAMTLGGYATGLLVESHEGRPTKVEGNPTHPASLGATDVFSQASILSLYDPDRSQAVLNNTRPSTWTNFVTAIQRRMGALRGGGQANAGEGFRILTETITSPTLNAQLQALMSELPGARWTQYEPVGRDNAREGARLALGQNAHVYYRFDRATRILSMDSDFLYVTPGTLRYGREFIDRRRVDNGQTEMNRLYVAESSMTNTGAMADHRVRVRASDMEALARALANALGVDVGGEAAAPASVPAEWLQAVAADLQGASGTGIIIAGDHLPASVHALVHAMNDALGNIGQTVIVTEPIEADAGDSAQSIVDLVADMNAGRISTLIILGGNPVFDAPGDLRFREALEQVELRVHLSMNEDETSEWCQWHIPQVHYLEEWSDARAYDGTVSIVQPLIAPLYNGLSAHQVVDVLLGNSGESNYDIVNGYWSAQYEDAGGDWPDLPRDTSFEAFWQTVLHEGVVPNTAAPALSASVNASAVGQAAAAPEGMEIVFRPDPGLWDGRFANNAWLQELPRPITTLTWDNAALMSAATASRMGLSNNSMVRLTAGGAFVEMPTWIMPGHVDDSVTVYMGFGRTRAGSVGNNTGFNVYPIRNSATPGVVAGAEATPAGGTYKLVVTQEHSGLEDNEVENRGLVRHATLEEFLAHPNFAQATAHDATAPQDPEAEQEQAEEGGDEGAETHHPSLLPDYDYSQGYAWGMTVNLNACIGCNACVVGCQSENNIPTVGKLNVDRSREMHWMKIDRYYMGDVDQPDAYFQPRFCMHCEKAPCELVCPVGATSHSSEGLNEMTYNRCVGTKYCSNNCPYKVRRYNFLDYTREEVPLIRLMANPDVTIRSLGVMEKCTYCVQRIEASRIEADNANRRIQDGEIKTACMQACPTQALVFGDINDPNSEVSRLKATGLNYKMLDELGTEPRTSYLARIRNPNPDIPNPETA